ncbi:MAG TPA: phosphoglycolate phosphatase [Hyphomicrobiaceae bacterium]|nr:phosphoglycolate phosphatase [Hyphomicrobiaceae bacterium]
MQLQDLILHASSCPPEHFIAKAAIPPVTRSPLTGATIVFDLDGTLIDTAPDLVGAANHALARLALPPRPAEALRPWISFGARRMIEEGLDQCGVKQSPARIDQLLAVFLDHYEANIARLSRPYPHVLDEISRLTSAGASIAICTNKREALTFKLLDALQLTQYFAAIIGRDTLPVSKPDPDHLIGTIARAGGRVERAVMVGDSGVDIATARAARVPVVGVSFGYSDVPIKDLNPDVTIDTYANLAGVIGPLLPAV